MRLHLVSLALLLLALCRTASSGPSFTVVSDNMKSSTTSMSIGTPETQAAAAKNIGVPKEATAIAPTPEQAAKLLDQMGNTMISFAFIGADIMQKIPDFLQHATMNGWICDADRNGLADTVMKAMYPAGRTAAEKLKEDAEAKKLNPPIICGTPPAPPSAAYKCFCTDEKALLYCIVVALKDAAVVGFNEAVKNGTLNADWETKLVCREKALEDLKTTAAKIGSLYDLKTPSEKDNAAIQQLFSGDAKGIDSISKAEATQFFCEAIEKTVYDAVAKLYFADNLYWLTEAAVMTVLFGPNKKDITTVCAMEDFKKTKYGECLCKLETGISFCIYKVLGEYFKQEGYLNCETKTFDVAKKPAAVPAAILSGGGGGGGGGSGSAATSSLLLAPLTAAAAMLLRL